MSRWGTFNWGDRKWSQEKSQTTERLGLIEKLVIYKKRLGWSKKKDNFVWTKKVQ